MGLNTLPSPWKTDVTSHRIPLVSISFLKSASAHLLEIISKYGMLRHSFAKVLTSLTINTEVCTITVSCFVHEDIMLSQVCVHSFSHHWDQISGKTRLKGGTFYFGLWLGRQSHHGGEGKTTKGYLRHNSRSMRLLAHILVDEKTEQRGFLIKLAFSSSPTPFYKFEVPTCVIVPHTCRMELSSLVNSLWNTFIDKPKGVIH